MKVAITGSTGFIGKKLTYFLAQNGAKVASIHRDLLLEENKNKLVELLANCNVVINLAGSSINCKWTESNKTKIRESRIFTTRALVCAINELPSKPSTFISTSAVGIYSEENVWNEEEGTYENDFLSKVCQDWESEAQKVSSSVRLVIARLGVVLDKNEGAFPQMRLPFQYYVGGIIGSGYQGFSWIHIDDLLHAFWFLINKEEVSGVVHCTAPQICDNYLFTYTVARAMKRPVFFSLPDWTFKLLLGERSSIILKGQKVFPSKLINNNFHFEYESLHSAIKSLIM